MSKSTSTPQLGIEAVSRRSGLSQHLIRIWERRYGVVKPARTKSNRRLYSEEDAHRLELLNRAVHAGHRIGDIAKISTEKLELLVGAGRPNGTITSLPSVSDEFNAAIEAIERFDAEALTMLLARADVEFGQSHTLELIIMPLMERIGTLWKDGEIRIAQEHMATAAVIHHVGSILANFRYQLDAPVIVVATPLGQEHEAGALAAAVVAAVSGWRPIYIGPNLPAEEIAGVAVKSNARAVALSLIFPADDPKLPAELGRLSRLLPNGLSILIGGRAAEQYMTAIDSIRAILIPDVAMLRQHLEEIHTRTGQVTT